MLPLLEELLQQELDFCAFHMPPSCSCLIWCTEACDTLVVTHVLTLQRGQHDKLKCQHTSRMLCSSGVAQTRCCYMLPISRLSAVLLAYLLSSRAGTQNS